MESQDLVFILIALLLAIVVFYLFIWLLPVIVILLIAFIIYAFLNDRYGNGKY